MRLKLNKNKMISFLFFSFFFLETAIKISQKSISPKQISEKI